MYEINTVELKNNSAMKDKYIYKLVNGFFTRVIIFYIAIKVLSLPFESKFVEKNEPNISKVENLEKGNSFWKPVSHYDLCWIIGIIGIIIILSRCYIKNKKRIEDMQKRIENMQKNGQKIDSIKKDVEYLKSVVSTKKYENNDKDNNGINVSVNVNNRDC